MIGLRMFCKIEIEFVLRVFFFLHDFAVFILGNTPIEQKVGRFFNAALMSVIFGPYPLDLAGMELDLAFSRFTKLLDEPILYVLGNALKCREYFGNRRDQYALGHIDPLAVMFAVRAGIGARICPF